MAQVVIGSRRVTRDFDFVIPHPGERLPQLVDAFYDRGLELASRVNGDGEVTGAPVSAYFLHPKTGLRIDSLFDFPIPAAEPSKGASRTRVRSFALRIASDEDLLRLKKIARARRADPRQEMRRTSRSSKPGAARD